MSIEDNKKVIKSYALNGTLGSADIGFVIGLVAATIKFESENAPLSVLIKYSLIWSAVCAVMGWFYFLFIKAWLASGGGYHEDSGSNGSSDSGGGNE